MSWLTDQINLDDIHRVVQQFYLKARHHPVIGHHFDDIADFSAHEKKITGFWWMVMGGNTLEIPGGPPRIDMINKHMALGISAEDLSTWVGMFEQTLFDELPMDVASAWQVKVHEIASHLKALVIDGQTGGIQIKESREL